jgi:hypothetical protein
MPLHAGVVIPIDVTPNLPQKFPHFSPFQADDISTLQNVFPLLHVRVLVANRKGIGPNKDVWLILRRNTACPCVFRKSSGHHHPGVRLSDVRRLTVNPVPGPCQVSQVQIGRYE